MKRALNFGLIGAGRWGRVFINTIGQIDGVRLAALASRNPESRQLVPPDCTLSANWRALIDGAAGSGKPLDGLIIATPPATHAEIALAAIDADLPVLVEKPLSLSARQAEEIRARSESRSVVALVEHTHLFSPAYRALKQRLGASGGAAEVTAIEGTASNWGPFRKDVPVLWDWGAHDIAMCIDLMASVPDKFSVRRLEKRNQDEGIGETLEISMGFADNAWAEIRLSNLADHKERRLEVICRGETLIYDDTVDAKLTYRRGLNGKVIPIPHAPTPPLTVAVEEFAEAVHQGRTDNESMKLAVDVVKTLERLEACLIGD